MPARDHQGMPGRDWIAIPNDHTMLAFVDDSLGWKGAKRTVRHESIQP